MWQLAFNSSLRSLAKETSNAGELWVRLRDFAIINKVEKISRMFPNNQLRASTCTCIPHECKHASSSAHTTGKMKKKKKKNLLIKGVLIDFYYTGYHFCIQKRLEKSLFLTSVKYLPCKHWGPDMIP